jgi:hypothetical protein
MTLVLERANTVHVPERVTTVTGIFFFLLTPNYKFVGCNVAWSTESTDVTEEYITSIFRVEEEA